MVLYKSVYVRTCAYVYSLVQSNTQLIDRSRIEDGGTARCLLRADQTQLGGVHGRVERQGQTQHVVQKLDLSLGSRW